MSWKTYLHYLPNNSIFKAGVGAHKGLWSKRNIVESALYVKKKWGTIYGVSGMRYGRKGREWLQKEGSSCDHLLNRWELPHFGPILDGLIH